VEELKEEPAPKVQPKRPLLLTILCILTYVGSGLNLLSSLLVFFFFSEFQAVAPEILRSFNISGLDVILNATPAYFLVSAIIYSLSVGGAWYMWNLRKMGFHLYTISQILLVIAPMFFLKISGAAIPALIVPGIFILLYGINLKHMS
jgi:hypothetical protein